MRRPGVRRGRHDQPPPSDTLYAELANQVYRQRIARQLSQSELAELCGTSQPAIARVERGDRPPRIDTLQRIADALDCNLTITLNPRTEMSDGSTPEGAH